MMRLPSTLVGIQLSGCLSGGSYPRKTSFVSLSWINLLTFQARSGAFIYSQSLMQILRLQLNWIISMQPNTFSVSPDTMHVLIAFRQILSISFLRLWISLLSRIDSLNWYSLSYLDLKCFNDSQFYFLNISCSKLSHMFCNQTSIYGKVYSFASTFSTSVLRYGVASLILRVLLL